MNKFFLILCIIVFLFKTQTVFSNNLIYDVNNVQVTGKISKNLDRKKLIQSAFQKAFTTFINKTLLKKDAVTLYKTKINTIEDLVFTYQIIKEENIKNKENILTLNKAITLNNINYNYPDASRAALKDINLTIPAKSKVGLIGPSGCGKTTTVDIILKLLEPLSGTLKVDGEIITEQNSMSWQRSIGYVPQNIYLSDNTIMANIAFGVETENINQDMIKKVSKIANLHQFIVDELPNQYQTIVGERGIRLSGGQRQRIGIARALYHNPKVLILDEATSALDTKTEKSVMEAVCKLSNQITIIVIAHRINTVKDCDTIFKLEKGKIINQGTFTEMFNT